MCVEGAPYSGSTLEGPGNLALSAFRTPAMALADSTVVANQGGMALAGPTMP